MNIEKKAPTKSGTASVAPTFRLDVGLRHNLKQGVPVHFEIWAVSQTAGQTLQIRVIQRSVVSLLLLLLLGWGHRFFLLTYSGLSLDFP